VVAQVVVDSFVRLTPLVIEKTAEKNRSIMGRNPQHLSEDGGPFFLTLFASLT
jgi:hypothetical protein